MNFWMIVAIIEFILLVILFFYTYKFAIKIIKTEDNINLAIDLLEQRYKSISNILDRPVFFDSVEIRQVISDIYECQKTIYNIAVSIGNLEEEEEVKVDDRKEKDEEGE